MWGFRPVGCSRHHPYTPAQPETAGGRPGDGRSAHVDTAPAERRSALPGQHGSPAQGDSRRAGRASLCA